MLMEVLQGRHRTERIFNRLAAATDAQSDSDAPGSESDSLTPATTSECEILIVDDVTMTAGLTKVMLAHYGISSIVAYGGVEALECLDRHKIGVVLCDISMPGMNGIEVAKEIHARWNENRPKLIAYTAYPRDHERIALLEAGFDDFVAKPVRADTLATIIRKWMN